MSLLAKLFSYSEVTHQWPSGFKLKTGWRKELSSVPGRAYCPSCWEFSVIFSETPVIMGWDPLEKPHGRHSACRLSALMWRLYLILQSMNQPTYFEVLQDSKEVKRFRTLKTLFGKALIIGIYSTSLNKTKCPTISDLIFLEQLSFLK